MNQINKKKKLDPMWQYVITAYLVFWIMVLAICGTASIVFHAAPLTMRILSNVTAWSPTLVLLIMFKKLKPGMTIGAFYRKAFSGKLKAHLFFIIPCVVSGAILLTVFILSLVEHRPFTTYFSLGLYSIPASILLSLLSGPTGEESGWRGYLRNELNDRFSFLKASIIQGIIWTFWHTILWFVDSEFLDWRLIPYVISNVIVITSIVIIMNIILEKYDNLLYAIWIHFCFNLPYSFLQVNITYYMIMCVIFPIIAACFYLYRLKNLPDSKTVHSL